MLRKTSTLERHYSNLDSIAEFRILTNNFDAETEAIAEGRSA